MADPRNPEDARLAELYRALPREEPPEAIDAAVRAAARRAVGSRPGSTSRRWAAPLSAAAILVLAVGVTLRMQVEKPGIETAEPQRPAAAAVAQEPAADAASDPYSAAPPPPPRPAPEVKAEPAPRAKRAAPAEADVAPARKPEAQEMRVAPANRNDAAPAPFQPELSRAPATPQAAMADRAEPRLQKRAAETETPERQLERIAVLRTEGRHAEAEAALARFRREHPGFRIAPELWERVRSR